MILIMKQQQRFFETRLSDIDAKIILSNYRNCSVDEMNDNDSELDHLIGNNFIYLERVLKDYDERMIDVFRCSNTNDDTRKQKRKNN